MTDQPASEDEKWRGGEGGDLEKSETGDSGTCVDEILSPGALGPSKEEEEEEERKGEEYEEVFEAEDLVQLTVSSLASLGMLEDVPEHADEDNSDLVDEQATVREDINGKKTFSFGHCPNHLTPPTPPDPNSSNLVFFRTSKFKI